MTLILAAGNCDQFIQMSDRRLTKPDGSIVDDESNKSILLQCANARLAIGFTGLAGWGAFNTRKWLLSALNECSLPDRTAENLFNRLAVRATEQFRQLPIPQARKRLTIMATGYLDHHEPPLGGLAVISNCHDLDTGGSIPGAWDHFRCFFRCEPRPSLSNIALFFHVGVLPPVPRPDSAKVVELVKARKPADAIVGKLVEVFRSCAESPFGGNLIGKQLMSVIIPRDRGRTIQCAYHSDTARRETYFPDQVLVVSDKLHMNVIDVSVGPGDPGLPPISGPRLRAGQPCWCKSGKKFKRCHGRRSQKRVPISLVAKEDS